MDYSQPQPDYTQANSVFMPGLTRRGPVYAGSGMFGALPSLPPMAKYGAIAVLAYLAYRKKISPILAAVGGFAVYQLFPDATAAAATPAAPIVISNPIAPLDLSSGLMNTPMPVFPPIASPTMPTSQDFTAMVQ